MTIEEVMNLSASDIEAMTDSELRKATRTLVDAANKRMKRIEQRDEIYSPAYLGARRTGGSFKTSRGTDRQALLNEFKRAKQFLSYKTSTSKGTKSWMKNVEESTGLAFSDSAFELQQQISAVYNDVASLGLSSFESDQIHEIIRIAIFEQMDEQDEYSSTKIINRIKEWFDEFSETGRDPGTAVEDFHSFTGW